MFDERQTVTLCVFKVPPCPYIAGLRVHGKERLAAVQPSERRDSDGRAIRNKILTSLPESEYRAALPHLDYVALPQLSVLHEPSEKLEFAYFPNAGLISLVVAMENGKTVEAAVLGNEGAAGIPSAVYLTHSPLREVVQVAGDGFRVKVQALRPF